MDQNRDFQVESLYDVIDLSMIGESSDTVRAALVVNDNPYIVIRFAKVFYNGDKLSILLHETNESDNHKYLISILNNKYKITYNYIASGENEDDGFIVPYETKLILKKFPLKSGTVLKGYTEFKGKCGSCKEEWIIVKGTFEVVLKK